jgi:Family of unknown function (DUF6624)
VTPERLRGELLQRAERDRDVRRRIRAGQPPAGGIDLDRDNTAWLKRVVEAVGWPCRSVVGQEAAHAAWLLAQHADLDPHFQRRCRELMAGAVADGEASPADLAYLTDRVLVNSGQAQLYGTQLRADSGRLVPQRLASPDRVDARRATVGLKPLDVYLTEMAEAGEPLEPARLACPGCGGELIAWLPGPADTTIVTCPACQRRMRLRARWPARPGEDVVPGPAKLSSVHSNRPRAY